MTMMTSRLVVLVIVAFLSVGSLAVDSQSNGVGEWSLVTKLNFSSQTRLHPHILLLVTVPWSGESRSLMRELMGLVINRQEEFNSLKLMFMHRNTEKMLADAIGATPDEITILYYHHSLAYKYRGKLRAQNILFSISSHISVPSEELPLKSLSNPEELKTFLDSTDRALLVLEFCGWTSKLLAKRRSNVGENDFTRQEWTSKRLTSMGMNMQKDMEKMTCDIDNEVGQAPWLVDFRSVRSAAPLEELVIKTPGVLSSSCTSEEYQEFDSFFTKFIAVARDFFLPSERHGYGLVSNRSMVSTLGVKESGSWFAVLHYAGCPSCLKIIKKEDDLTDVMKMDNSVISELESDGRALEPVLPANRQSILLFVDRSSDLEEIRSQSKKALDGFRGLALHIHNSFEVEKQSSDKHEKLFQDQALVRSTSGPPKLKLSSAAQMIKLKEKMSTVMIVNEGKHITLDKISSDLQGSSLHEILAYVLQQKKEAKLSSLAKELGFQLLSDDIDIKIVNRLSSEEEKELVSMAVDQVQDPSSNGEGLPIKKLPVTSKVTGSDDKDQYEVEKNKEDIYGSIMLASGSSSRGVKVEETSSVQDDESEHQQIEFPGLKGSFFFSDGNYQLLQALTGESKIPRMVIVDDAVEQHYVFPEEKVLDYYSMADFLSRFLNGSLLPYIKSESINQSCRKASQLPLDNQVDSVPRVTSNSFSELVVGVNQSYSDAWHSDVVVLFSNRWCGFCQRMELVVGEVYRAIKGYIRTSKIGDTKDVNLKLPSTYLLDCTLNDCSLILRSVNQTEAYPTLMLFPAETKVAHLYDGHVGVADIIKFIADRGLYSKHIIHEAGILESIGRNDRTNENSHRPEPSTDGLKESAIAKERFHEVLLANPMHKKPANQNNLKSHSSISSDRALVEAGSILIATDKLQNAQPFGKSIILIVKADQITGFQGLIINKHITWDTLKELEEGVQILTEAPLSFGGPLMQHGSILVALYRGLVGDKFPQVLPDIYFLDQLATHDKIKEFKSGSRSVSDYWFFVGYSSWGWNQLYDEIADEAWSISNDSLADFAWP